MQLGPGHGLELDALAMLRIFTATTAVFFQLKEKRKKNNEKKRKKGKQPAHASSCGYSRAETPADAVREAGWVAVVCRR